MLRFYTAGESHGKGLLAVLDGLPAGINISSEHINYKLSRRQGGYGRGGRMRIEKDQAEIISGIRAGKTIGSPVGLIIYNRDWENWQEIMSDVERTAEAGADSGNLIRIEKDGKLREVERVVTRPRPGHADLAAAMKYNSADIRNILERASARETAARVAVGAITDCLLEYFGIEIISHVIQIGEIKTSVSPDLSFKELKERILESELNCFDGEKEKEMMAYIDRVKAEGDSLGGVIELRTTPLPVGLGTHTQWDRRLDGLIARAIMSIPAIKGVEIGPAFDNSGKKGSQVHDEIFYDEEIGFYRKTNRAGGLEGGVTNGEPIIIRAAMKPIPTLYKPLNSVDIRTRKPVKAGVERSDITAVPAAGIVAEAMLSFVLAQAILEKFGGDSIEEVMANYNSYTGLKLE